MTGGGGLPYEECRREQQRRQEAGVPLDRAPLYPAYALPPFHPGTRATARHRRKRKIDGDLVSGVLSVLGVATLLVTVVVAAVRPGG
ncbi:hypothetical protein [Streptomyces sp. NK08204]|uniref:hypothetical protein n=1 Tax=Streptomyces sp. NK08204 TaxID=2873260 RepID=UPI001CEC7984|nr:hypothetical protein [Streptomyces sp. NK08204]